MKKLIYIILLILPCLAWGITHSVKQDGSGDYAAIQTALDACSPGDTVLVYPGRYFENVVVQTSNISLISLEAITSNPVYIDSTIIDGSMINSCLRVSNGKTGITIQGFSFSNGLSFGSGGGLLFSTDSVSFIVDCKIFNNTARSGGGISAIGASVSLTGVELFGNYSVYLGGGLFGSGVNNISATINFDPVNRCSIYNNRAGAGQDIYIQEATSNMNAYLDTFSIAEPREYHATYLSENPTQANYHIFFDILNVHHHEINQDIYVSPNGNDDNDGLSPDNPLKTIHEGIYRITADSLDQRTVHILPGTYSRTDNDQVFPVALKSWVMVQGSGINSTLIIGELNPIILVGDNPHNDVFMSNEQDVVSLSGMTITTQNSDNDSALFGNSYGSVNLSDIYIHSLHTNELAAISLYLGSDYESRWDNVTIENITTQNMGLVDIGGGIRGTISSCDFQDATSTYTSASVWAYPLISFIGDQYLTFENCEFSNLTMLDDDSRAIQVGANQNPLQQNIYTFNNCLFSNITSQGSVIVVGSSGHPYMNFSNCTFACNESDSFILMLNGNVNIANSIFYNNSPYQIKVNPMVASGETTTININYSNIQDGYAGIQQAAGNTINYSESNISGNPLFLGGDDIHDPLYYSLGAGSPCINSGTPDTLGLNLLPYDLAGNWRVWEGRIDMGCFEYGSPPVANDDPIAPDIPAVSMTAYPNPFSVFTNIRADIPARGESGAEAINAARIVIYNLRGQIVRSLELDPGTRQQVLSWDGRDSGNQRCSNGIYFLNLVVDGRSIINKKVTLIR